MRVINNDWQLSNPELVFEWHKENQHQPNDVSRGSDKKIFWQCRKNSEHIWATTILSRIKGSGCPYCSGRRATKSNNIEKCYPMLCKEWNYAKNDFFPKDFLPSSNKKIWWKCNSGHEWQTSICNRVRGKTECPYCVGKNPTKENCLLNYPILCEEWDYEKNVYRPEHFLPKSHKKAWWKCSNGHEYLASIASRSHCNTGCPFCAWQTSKLEIRLYCELKSLFKNVKWRDRSFGFEIDVLCNEIAIEVDGWYWHKDKLIQDEEKNNKIKKLNLTPLRVRGLPLSGIGENNIFFKKNQTDKIIVPKVVFKVAELLNLKIDYSAWINDVQFKKLILKKTER